MDVQGLLAKIEDSLATAIPAAVERTFFMEPLYAILVDYIHWGYFYDGDTGAPLVVAAPLSVRRTIMNEHQHPDSVQWDAGYVSEIPGSIRLKLAVDDAFMAHCSKLYSSVDQDDVRTPTMLQRLAARLNSVNWNKVTSVTDDFIVCLQDSLGEHDCVADIESCVPRDRISLLQSRGLLWKWPRKSEPDETAK
jgi:hypothetical protein